MNYVPSTPVDRNGMTKTGYPPAKLALAATHKENTSTSSVLLFTHDTTEIAVHAVNTGVAGKWAANSATSVIAIAGTANFDFVVPAGDLRHLVVPVQSNTPSNGSIMGINRSAGLYPGVAFITIAGGPGSVLTAQF